MCIRDRFSGTFGRFEPRFGNREFARLRGVSKGRAGRVRWERRGRNTHLARESLEKLGKSLGDGERLLVPRGHCAKSSTTFSLPNFTSSKWVAFDLLCATREDLDRSIAFRSPDYDLTSRPHGASRRDLPRLWREGTPGNPCHHRSAEDFWSGQSRGRLPKKPSSEGHQFSILIAEDGIRDSVASRGLGDVYKRQP